MATGKALADKAAKAKDKKKKKSKIPVKANAGMPSYGGGM